jgi:SOS-response transcriptional repressor LexA
MVPSFGTKGVPIVTLDDALQFTYLSGKWAEGVSRKGGTVIPHVDTGISAFGVQVPQNFGMEPRFLKGDILIVDPSIEVKNGDIGLMEINGEIKCRVIELGEVIRLRAINEKYAEIIVRPGVDFRIIGKVVDMIPQI